MANKNPNRNGLVKKGEKRTPEDIKKISEGTIRGKEAARERRLKLQTMKEICEELLNSEVGESGKTYKQAITEVICKNSLEEGDIKKFEFLLSHLGEATPKSVDVNLKGEIKVEPITGIEING